MLERAIRAIKADPDLFEMVEHDDGYTGEAAIIVAITAILGAIGTLITPGAGGIGSAIAALIGGIIGWIIWAALTNFIGTRFFGATSDFGEMSRVIGFAHAPMVLSVVPFVGWLAGLWSLYVAVVAMRQGLDVSTGKAVIVGVLGIIVVAIGRFIIPGI